MSVLTFIVKNIKNVYRDGIDKKLKRS